jgi:hypothetical protein
MEKVIYPYCGHIIASGCTHKMCGLNHPTFVTYVLQCACDFLHVHMLVQNLLLNLGKLMFSQLQLQSVRNVPVRDMLRICNRLCAICLGVVPILHHAVKVGINTVTYYTGLGRHKATTMTTTIMAMTMISILISAVGVFAERNVRTVTTSEVQQCYICHRLCGLLIYLPGG